MHGLARLRVPLSDACDRLVRVTHDALPETAVPSAHRDPGDALREPAHLSLIHISEPTRPY